MPLNALEEKANDQRSHYIPNPEKVLTPIKSQTKVVVEEPAAGMPEISEEMYSSPFGSKCPIVGGSHNS
jgi:hypothetical protein